MLLSELRKKQLESELHFSATRSSGPGGQHVNKVNTQVELRFSVSLSSFLSISEKQRLLVKLKNRINDKGELIILSQTERSQLRNKVNTLEKFFSWIEKALTIPKKRIKTLPTASSRRKRIESKKIISQKKQLRKPPES